MATKGQVDITLQINAQAKEAQSQIQRLAEQLKNVKIPSAIGTSITKEIQKAKDALSEYFALYSKENRTLKDENRMAAALNKADEAGRRLAQHFEELGRVDLKNLLPTDILDKFKSAQEVVDKLGKEYEKTIKNQNSAKEKQKKLEEQLIELGRSKDQLTSKRTQLVASKSTEDQIKAEQAELKKRQEAYAKKLAVNNREAQTDEAVELAKNRSIVSAFTSKKRTIKRAEEQEQLKVLQKEQTELQKSAKAADDAVKAYEQGDNALAKVTTSVGQYLDKIKDYYEQYKKLAGNSALSFDEWRKSDKKTAIKAREVKPEKTSVSEEEFKAAQAQYQKLLTEREKAKQALAENESKISALNGPLQAEQQAYDVASESVKNFEKDLSESKDAITEQEKYIKSLTDANKEADNSIKKIDNDLEKNTKLIEDNKAETARLLAEQSKLGTDAQETFNKIRVAVEAALGKELPEGIQNVEQLKEHLSNLKAEEITKVKQALDQMGSATEKASNAANKGARTQNEYNQALNRTEQEAKESQREIDNLGNRFKQLFTLTSGIQIFRRAIREAFNTIKELDAVMTQTAVVSDYTVSDMWSMLPQYTKNAQALGVAISDVYSAQTLYIQQGLDFKNSMDLGIESLKMARIANIDAASATQAMTAALRGFNMELNETSAKRVNDVYSELAKITAADTQQISTAMTKTASIAHSANMEFEKTAALLSQIIETTQEAPETAGTAMKTIIGRFTEIKKLYSKGELEGTDEEGETIKVNRVSTALSAAGINLNEFFTGAKGLDDIFLELAKKWDTLDIVTQRYIATMAAGSRQQSRFIAMMQDYARTMDLVSAAENSEGSSQKQFEKTLDSMQSKLAALKDSWNEFTMGIMNSDLAKGAVDFAKKILDLINKITASSNGLLGSIKKLGVGLAAFGLGKKVVNGKFGFSMLQRLFLGSGKGEEAVKPIITEFFGNLQKAAASEATKGKIFSFGDLVSAWIGTKGHQHTGLMSLFNTFSLKNIRNNNLFDAFNQFEDELGGGESWDKLVKALKKTGLSMDEAQDKASTLQEALINLKGGVGRNSETFNSSAATIKEFNESLTYTPTIIPKLKAGLKNLGTTIINLGKTILKISPYILAVVAAYAALKAAITYFRENSYEGKLEAINKSTKALKEQTQQLDEEYKKLNSTLDNLSENDKVLNKLIVGTDSWKKKIDESNKAILELIEQYQDLAKYVSSNTVDGKIVLSIDEKQAKKAIEDQQLQVQIEQDTDSIQRVQLEQENLYKNLDSKIKRPFEDKKALDSFIDKLFNNTEALVALNKGQFGDAIEIAGLEQYGVQSEWLSENYKALQAYYSKSTGYEAEIAGYTSSILDNTFKMAYGDELTVGQKAARNSVSTEDWNRTLASVDKRARNKVTNLQDYYWLNGLDPVQFFDEKTFDYLYKYLLSKGMTVTKGAKTDLISGQKFYELQDENGKRIDYGDLHDIGYNKEDFITFIKNEMASERILNQSDILRTVFDAVPKDSLLYKAISGDVEDLTQNELEEAYQLLSDFAVENAKVFKEADFTFVEFYENYQKRIRNLMDDTAIDVENLSKILGDNINDLSNTAIKGLFSNIQKVIIEQGKVGEEDIRQAFEELFNNEYIQALSDKDKKIFFNLLSSTDWSIDNLQNLSTELKKLGIVIPDNALDDFIDKMGNVSKVFNKPLDTKEIEKYQTALLKLSKAIRESALDDSSWRQMSEDTYKALTYQNPDFEKQFVYNAENDTWDYIGDNTSEILEVVSNIYGVISNKDQLKQEVGKADAFDEALQMFELNYTDIMDDNSEQGKKSRKDLFDSIIGQGILSGLFEQQDWDFYQAQAALYGDEFITSFIESFYSASLKKAENLEKIESVEEKEEQAKLQVGAARSRINEEGRPIGRTRRVDETASDHAHKREDVNNAIVADLLNAGFDETIISEATTQLAKAAEETVTDEEWAAVADIYEQLLDYSTEIKKNSLLSEEAWKDGAEYLMRTQGLDVLSAYKQAYEELKSDVINEKITDNIENWAKLLRANLGKDGKIDWGSPTPELKEFIDEVGDIYYQFTGKKLDISVFDEESVKLLEALAKGDYSKLPEFRAKFGIDLNEDDFKAIEQERKKESADIITSDITNAIKAQQDKTLPILSELAKKRLMEEKPGLYKEEDFVPTGNGDFTYIGDQNTNDIISTLYDIATIIVNGLTGQDKIDATAGLAKSLVDSQNGQQLYGTYATAEEDMQNALAVAMLNKLNEAGVAETFVQDFTQKLREGLLNANDMFEASSMLQATQATENGGYNTEEIAAYAESLKELHELENISKEDAYQLALANRNLNSGLQELADGWKDWNKALQKSKPGSDAYENAVSGLNKALKKMFGLSGNLSREFLTSKKTAELLAKAIKGDYNAITQLQRLAARDVITKMFKNIGKWANTSEKEIDSFFDTLDSYVDALGKIDLGDSFDLSGPLTKSEAQFIDYCNYLLQSGKYTAEELSDMLQQMYGIQISTGTLPVEGSYESAIFDATGAATIISGPLHSEIPVITGATKIGGGSLQIPHNGGGGGGGGGGEKKEPWKNSFDRFHNLKEAAQRTDRERNKLEREYNNLLKEQANILNKNDFHKNLLDQVEALKQQVKYSKDLVEYYDELAKGKNWEAVEWMKQNADLKQYLEFDDETDEILIDWDRINQITDQDEGSHLEEIYQKLEEFRNAIWEAEDNRDAAIDKQNELIETLADTYADLREAFLTMEERIRDAIYDARQKEIDELDAIYEAQDNNNSKILDGINEVIDEQRKAREQQKQRDELEEKQRRLTLLKQDTSGANSLEILALEKELQDAQQNYVDSLVDNALEEISKGNEKAQEQRDMQIELLQWMLDYDKDHGLLWEQVEQLMADAYSEDGELRRNSALVQLLQATEEFEALSKFGQDKWWDDLKADMVKAMEGNKIADALLNVEKTVIDLAKEMLQTGNNQEFRRDKGTNTGAATGSGGSSGSGGSGGGSGNGKKSGSGKVYTASWDAVSPFTKQAGGGTVESTVSQKDADTKAEQAKQQWLEDQRLGYALNSDENPDNPATRGRDTDFTGSHSKKEVELLDAAVGRDVEDDALAAYEARKEFAKREASIYADDALQEFIQDAIDLDAPTHPDDIARQTKIDEADAYNEWLNGLKHEARQGNQGIKDQPEDDSEKLMALEETAAAAQARVDAEKARNRNENGLTVGFNGVNEQAKKANGERISDALNAEFEEALSEGDLRDFNALATNGDRDIFTGSIRQFIQRLFNGSENTIIYDAEKIAAEKAAEEAARQETIYRGREIEDDALLASEAEMERRRQERKAKEEEWALYEQVQSDSGEIANSIKNWFNKQKEKAVFIPGMTQEEYQAQLDQFERDYWADYYRNHQAGLIQSAENDASRERGRLAGQQDLLASIDVDDRMEAAYAEYVKRRAILRDSGVGMEDNGAYIDEGWNKYGNGTEAERWKIDSLYEQGKLSSQLKMYASADDDQSPFTDPKLLNKLLGSNLGRFTVGQNSDGYYISDHNGSAVTGLSFDEAYKRILDIAGTDFNEERISRGNISSTEKLSLANRLRIDTRKNGELDPQDFINQVNKAFSSLYGASISYDAQEGLYSIHTNVDNPTGKPIDAEFQSDVIETLAQWQKEQQQKEEEANKLLLALSAETGLSAKQIADLIGEKGQAGIEQLDALYELDLDLSDQEKDLLEKQMRQNKEIGEKNENNLNIINSTIGDAGTKLEALGAVMEKINYATGGRNASYTDSTGKKWTWTATGADAGVNYENWLLEKINAVEAQIKKSRETIPTSSTPDIPDKPKNNPKPTTSGNKDTINKIVDTANKGKTQEEKNAAITMLERLGMDDKVNGKYKKFDTGGYTGDWHSTEGKLAILHQKELVLNARDTENFIQLRDILRDMDIGNPNTGITNYEIHIEVDEISDDYSVEQLADKVKDLIVEESGYRNVNQINTTR